MDSRVQVAERLMHAFAARTGIDGGDAGRRYLWTDSFAVCALLGLYGHTGNPAYLGRARRLVELVHHVLGRYRTEDHRSGWISGLSELEGERRPTFGGLRIGKPLPERSPSEPYDASLEWERDGQYFHYLTKWMHALTCMSAVTRDARYNGQAADLVLTADRAFVYAPHDLGPKRMYWKMSTDLARPLVHSMGLHDPLDGLVTFSRVRAAHRQSDDRAIDLDRAIRDMRHICKEISSWATPDPLGIGGLLTQVGGLVQLIVSGHHDLNTLLNRLLADSERSVQTYATGRTYAAPCESRLAFRELGLSIGLQSLGPMHVAIEQHPDRFGGPLAAGTLVTRTKSLLRHAELAEQLEQSWLTPAAHNSTTWTAHRDINSVMLAVSLVPEAYLLPCLPEPQNDPNGAAGVRLSKGLSP